MKDVLGGKVALVTGGGTGIGLAIAGALAGAGAVVALTGRRLDVIEAAAESIVDAGGEATAIQGDVADPAGAAHMVERTVQAFGKLHILVNNAGAAGAGPIDEVDPEAVEQLIDVNFKGPILVTRAAVPELRRAKETGGASIINISTSATLSPVSNFSIYSAAKAAVEMLTRCWARELAPDRIRVNAICPGVVETPMFAGLAGDSIDAMRESFIAQTPLGRLGQPADIAELSLYLAGARSAWMTGAIIPLDGGISLGPAEG